MWKKKQLVPFLAVFIQNISSLQIKWGKSKGKIFHFYFQMRSDNELHPFAVLLKIWLKHTGYGHNCPQIYLFKKKWAESVLRQYAKPERHRTGPLLCQQGVGELSSLGRKSRLSRTRLGRWEICVWLKPLILCSNHLPAICICNVTGDTSQLKPPLLETSVCTSTVKLGSAAWSAPSPTK